MSSSYCESLEREKKNMGSQKISVSEQINTYHYTAEESENFVLDMDSFSPRFNNKDTTTKANSRITLQRSLPRKVNGNATLHDMDTVSATSSPKALVGSNRPEKTAAAVAVGSPRHSTNTHVHHQIPITAGNICSNNNNTTTESKSVSRRYNLRRPSSWLLDPKRVLLLFATLSCMGTMLLIYLTLSTSNQNMGEYGGD